MSAIEPGGARPQCRGPRQLSVPQLGQSVTHKRCAGCEAIEALVIQLTMQTRAAQR